MKIIKIISVTISLSSIFILSTMASILILSPIAIRILSIIGATLIGIDFKFKFHNKIKKKQLVAKLKKIHIKLEYVNTCNGNLTEQEYIEIFTEFNTVL